MDGKILSENKPQEDLLASERRRAIRIKNPDVSVSILPESSPPIATRVFDLSTLGISVITPFPTEDKVEFRFESPPVLKGIRISGQKRYDQPHQNEFGQNLRLSGYEFLFSEISQQARFHRWMTENFEKDPKIWLPLQAFFLKKMGLQSNEIKFPKKPAEFEQCIEIVSPLSIHHALVQTNFFMDFQRKLFTCCAVLIPDTYPFGLPADNAASKPLASIRQTAKRLGEITGPYFPEEKTSKKQNINQLYVKLNSLYRMMPPILIYAEYCAHLSDLVILAPGHLIDFLKIWLFQEVGEDGKPVPPHLAYDVDKKYLMWLNLNDFKERFYLERPELALLRDNFWKWAEGTRFFDKEFFLNGSLIKKWFKEKNNLLADLNESQLSYLTHQFPELE